MMFGIWRRGRMGRGFMVLRLVSFLLAVIGFTIAVFMTFTTSSSPTQVAIVEQSERLRGAETVIANSSSNILPLLIVLGAVMFLAIGVGIGFALREHRFDEAEKLKNDTADEKKKKRLIAPEYAHTNDGEILEVVDYEAHNNQRI